MPGGTESGGLDFHDLFFFILTEPCDLFDEFVGEFLQVILAALEVIFRDQFFFFKIPDVIVQVAADVPYRNARFFEAVIHVFDQITAAVFSKGR